MASPPARKSPPAVNPALQVTELRIGLHFAVHKIGTAEQLGFSMLEPNSDHEISSYYHCREMKTNAIGKTQNAF